MTDREKLIELIGATHYGNSLVGENFQEGFIAKIADNLVANGVTVTDTNVGKWISVTEQEEPTENGTYLCHGYWFGSRRKQTETADFFGEWNIANNFILTHWMPLPEPSEGE